MGRLLGSLKGFSGADLGGIAIKAALERAGVQGEDVDYVFMGQVLLAGAGQITARQAAVAGGIPMTVPSTTVNKVCLSGIHSIMLADLLIQAGLAGLDYEVGQVDGVEARQAHLVDGGGRDRHGDAGRCGRLAGCDLPGAGLQHLAHEDVVDLVGGDPGPLERGLDGQAAQISAAERREGAGELADGCASTSEDDGTGHVRTPPGR